MGASQLTRWCSWEWLLSCQRMVETEGTLSISASRARQWTPPTHFYYTQQSAAILPHDFSRNPEFWVPQNCWHLNSGAVNDFFYLFVIDSATQGDVHSLMIFILNFYHSFIHSYRIRAVNFPFLGKFRPETSECWDLSGPDLGNFRGVAPQFGGEAPCYAWYLMDSIVHAK